MKVSHYLTVNISENCFTKEDDIPNTWKCAGAFGNVCELDNEPEPEPEPFLQQIIENSRVSSTLILDHIAENEIEESLKTGKIPIGFADCPVWPELIEKMKLLPDYQEEKAKQRDALQIEEEEIYAKLQKLEQEKLELETLLKTKRHQKKRLESEALSWEQFQKSQYQETIQYLHIIAKKESEFVERMKTLQNPDEFTDNCAGDLPLSLVFNAIGLSESTIKKLEYLSGYEFLNCSIQVECNDLDIQLREQFELEYCQKLWNMHGIFPGKAHETECVVCAHSSPEDFCYLLEEHQKPFDTDWIVREKISGRQFVGMTASYIRTLFPDNKDFSSTWMYFQKMHTRSISKSK